MLSAKVLILLFLGIGATSVYYGKTTHEQLQGLKGKVAKQEKKAKELLRDAKFMEENLQPDEKNIVLNEALADAVLSVMRNRLQYNITVGSITPHKNTGNSAVAPLEKLAEQVPGTKLKSIRFNLRGTYKDYTGLVGYLAELRKQPVAINYLKVEGENFELGIRVYGN